MFSCIWASTSDFKVKLLVLVNNFMSFIYSVSSWHNLMLQESKTRWFLIRLNWGRIWKQQRSGTSKMILHIFRPKFPLNCSFNDWTWWMLENPLIHWDLYREYSAIVFYTSSFCPQWSLRVMQENLDRNTEELREWWQEIKCMEIHRPINYELIWVSLSEATGKKHFTEYCNNWVQLQHYSSLASSGNVFWSLPAAETKKLLTFIHPLRRFHITVRSKQFVRFESTARDQTAAWCSACCWQLNKLHMFLRNSLIIYKPLNCRG